MCVCFLFSPLCVAVSADATPAGEEVPQVEETAAPVIAVAAPVTEVVPAAPALDISAEAAAGLVMFVRVYVCVRVCAQEKEFLLLFSARSSISLLSLSLSCPCPSHSHALPIALSVILSLICIDFIVMGWPL